MEKQKDSNLFRNLAAVLILLLGLITLQFWAEGNVSALDSDSSNQSAGLVQKEDGLYYIQKDGSPYTDGLLTVDGKLYWFGADGTAFTDGYKEVSAEDGTDYYYFQADGSAFTEGYKPFQKDGKRVYYYFCEDGKAYTGGFLRFEQGGKPYSFWFQADGSAFTGGYKEVQLDGKTYYYYFLANGQSFNTGYKTVMIDGKKYYFCFDSEGKAATDATVDITLGDRTAYFLFQSNGRAFTGGYKEVAAGKKTDYYYFLGNGQAYTGGYKTVKIDGVTYYFFFEGDGKAFTGGEKQVAFGTSSFLYSFSENGRAITSTWVKIDGKDKYYQANGRAAAADFVSYEGEKYYFDSACNLQKDGWFCAGDGYYFAQENGALLTNTALQGYRLDSNGKCALKYRVVQYINSHTTATMTKQEKIKALYDSVLVNSMPYVRNTEHAKLDWVWEDYWPDYMATSLLDNWGGNCFRFNSFIGFLIQEATGYPVTAYHGLTPGTYGLTPHGWITVEIDGSLYSFDVDRNKFSTFYTRADCYMVPYSRTEGWMYFDGVGVNLY